MNIFDARLPCEHGRYDSHPWRPFRCPGGPPVTAADLERSGGVGPDYDYRQRRNLQTTDVPRTRLGSIVWPKGAAAWDLIRRLLGDLNPDVLTDEEIIARLRARGELVQVKTVRKLRFEAGRRQQQGEYP